MLAVALDCFAADAELSRDLTKRDARNCAYKPLELAAGSVAKADRLGSYGTVILKTSPRPTGGGPKPTLET